jgi:hypothetical protein
MEAQLPQPRAPRGAKPESESLVPTRETGHSVHLQDHTAGAPRHYVVKVSEAIGWQSGC